MEQLDEKIEVIHNKIAETEAKKRRCRGSKVPKKNKFLKQLDEELMTHRNKLLQYEAVKDSKIPFYEKISKENIFYKHYMSMKYIQSIGEVAQNQV